MARKALFLWIILLSVTTQVCADETFDLAKSIEAIKQAAGQDESMNALYHLKEQLNLGQASLNSAEAVELTHFILDLAFTSEYSVQRMIARNMLKKHPHPAARLRLEEYLETQPDDPLKLRDTAMDVLALLHSSYVLDSLIEDLKSNQIQTIQPAIRRMIDLEDYHAVEPLKALLADTTLVKHLADGFIEYRRQFGYEPTTEEAERHTQRDARKVRRAADDAINKLQLLQDHGIRCEFPLPSKAMDKLGRQGALVMPWPKNEMYEWYDEKFPFVTTDFIYHTHMILVRAAIDELENLCLMDDLGFLSAGLATASLDQAENLNSDSLKNLALDNAALLLVPAVLCGKMDLDDLSLEPNRRAMVEAELARIQSANYQGLSLLLDVEEDYTEYKSRGRASTRRGEAGFFQARTWLARAAFPISNTTKTRRALLLAHATLDDPQLRARWQDLETLVTFLAGVKDDSDVLMYLNLAESISGISGPASLMEIVTSEKQLARFMNEAKLWPVPTINTAVDPDRGSALGLRLLGQRGSADGVLFQQLMEDGQWPVSGTQVVSELLQSDQTFDKTPGVMAGYLDVHQTLFDLPSNALPVFKSAIWQDKITNACLGAWAETRHAAAPYLKSAHTYAGISMMTDSFHGYVEPVPQFYRRLKRQAEMWHQLFVDKGVYDGIEIEIANSATMDEKMRLDSQQWPKFISILEKLADLAERELRSEKQTIDDGFFLKSLGESLRTLCFNRSSMNVAEKPMARIINVATEYQSGQVLQAGVGQAMPLFVAVPHGDKIIICRGAVYSYHELLLTPQNHFDEAQWGGLSAGQTILGKNAWLACESELMYQPVLERSELQQFTRFTKEIPHMDLGHRFPWRHETRFFNGVPPWVGSLANAQDTDILLEMALRQDLAPSLQLFVNRQLSRFASQPEVLAYWRSSVALVGSDKRPEHSPGKDLNVMRTFWALQVLARFGNESDGILLHRIDGQLGQYPQGNRKFEAWKPALDWSLKYAKQQTGNGK